MMQANDVSMMMPPLLYFLLFCLDIANSFNVEVPRTAVAVVPTTTNVVYSTYQPLHGGIMDHQFLLAEASSLLPKTQSQQMSDAMVLKTLQGTKWRLFIEVPNQQEQQSFVLLFQGFASQPNKGIVQLMKADNNDNGDQPTTGRWLSKPSEIRRGAVQLSARWKVKVPGGTKDASSSYIFKGFIRAKPTLSAGGGTMEAEMTGTILSVEAEVVVGKFRAELVDVNISDDELSM
mmetsp:Transcript_16416/g.24828  ORF Transcript_16416/g.24828 Transcript_16416/m.24828 type:complete len:233 (-) Transcript_16416:420-1118(-)